MARVRLLEKDQVDPAIRDTYQTVEDQGRQVINVQKVVSHCPYIGRNFQRLATSILRGEELPVKLRELAILRVGNILQAEYEFVSHTRIALRVGVSQKQIDEISDWATSPEFGDQERAVLQYTDEVERGAGVKDETFVKLQGFLSEHAIVELTITIGYYGMVSRLINALQIELEDESRSIQ